MNDSFLILGVEPGADQSAIRVAYRNLAKIWHPDQPRGDAAKFVQIRRAYEQLSNHQPRLTDKTNNRRHVSLLRKFIKRSSSKPASKAQTGSDIQLRLQVHIDDLINGAIRQLTLPDGRSVEFRIEKGHSESTKLKLKGLGEPGKNGGKKGDLLVELQIKPQKNLWLEGRDLHMELARPLWVLRKGGVQQIRTPAGWVKLPIPPLSGPGTIIKIRKNGLPANGMFPAGDLFVHLREQQLADTGDAVDAFLKNFGTGT